MPKASSNKTKTMTKSPKNSTILKPEITDKIKVKKRKLNTSDVEVIDSPIKKQKKNNNESKAQAQSKRKDKVKCPDEDLGPTSTHSLNKPIKHGKLVSNNDIILHDWSHVDYVSDVTGTTKPIIETVIQLFDNDNTIPFIARYRKGQTGGLDADNLRKIKESYDRSKAVKHKAELVIKSIEKSGKGSSEIYNAVKSATTLTELEDIHALYKTASKRTLAERARQLGLGPVAESVLKGNRIPYLSTLINPATKELSNEDEIKEGIVNILAESICKDKNIFEKIKELRKKFTMKIETTKVNKVNENKNPKNLKNEKNRNEDKYKTYYKWTGTNKYIHPYQILAINRAEKEKVISVKVLISDNLVLVLQRYTLELFKSGVQASSLHNTLINNAINVAFKKSVKPAIVRKTRSEMNERAEDASMEVFARNVKQLLLIHPVRGKIVLGLDPGFVNGCKLAVVSEQGDVLETATIYPHKKGVEWYQSAVDTLVTLIHTYQISMIALGNATACRETEIFVSDLIKSGKFGKQVVYAIVDEAGASIYSCSAEAKSEFPQMDCNVISAVSIARRLQDPLAELVKVEPKHLGIGMYQHDLPEKQLMSKLDETVIEAVSFVGVDVNTASYSLLRRVAGLSGTKAKNVIEWRKENGPFVNREQLRKVKGIGAKTFEQCAGFIRILPKTAKSALQSKSSTKNNFNALDQTWIHPESYKIANALIKAANVKLVDLGTASFISTIKGFSDNEGLDKLAHLLNTNISTLEVIIKGLTMLNDEDVRVQSKAPLFRSSVRSINDLTVDSELSGEVRNITDFGAFVDVGVERNGLIHIKYLEGVILEIGQRVNVKVSSVEVERGRISLILI